MRNIDSRIGSRNQILPILMIGCSMATLHQLWAKRNRRKSKLMSAVTQSNIRAEEGQSNLAL